MRFVIYSEELGVYLGSFLGLGFWSKSDPVGQTEAVTFASEDDIRGYVNNWENPIEDWRAVAVPNAPYVTIEQCVAAGLPAWEPL